MKLPKDIEVYGDLYFRGKCPSETLEQVTFFARVRNQYPDPYGRIAVHIRNESKRTHMQAAVHKSEGMTKGASDIIIPGAPTFVCELKRRDHTKSKLDGDQEEYLLAAKQSGAFTCIALGADAAMSAFADWLVLQRVNVDNKHMI